MTMTLTEAVLLVWNDVADCVLRHPTVEEAIAYARDVVTVDDLNIILEDQRSGHYDHPDSDVRGDVSGAYALVRAASQADVDAVTAAEAWRE